MCLPATFDTKLIVADRHWPGAFCAAVTGRLRDNLSPDGALVGKVAKFQPKIELIQGYGNKALSSIGNLLEILRKSRITVRYNDLSKKLDIDIPGQTFALDNRLNCGLASLTSIMHENNMPSSNLREFLFMVADANRFNPIADWIESEPWDGFTRIKNWYDTIKCENNELKETLMRRWAVGAIAAVYEPKGVAGAGVLVLQGRQNLGKTNWFKNLVPNDLSDTIKDGVALDLTNKDTIMGAIGYWLVELGELPHTIGRSGVDSLKAFFSNNTDVMRLPYAHATSQFPRRTVFCGTVNEGQFLKDQTGNRRYFTIACDAINHTHGLDMQKIWAEFKVLYDNGEKWFLDEEEMCTLNESNEEHEVVDPLFELIMKYYDWDRHLINSENVTFKTATEILKDIDCKVISKANATRCGFILKKIQTVRRQKRTGSTVWGMPPSRI